MKTMCSRTMRGVLVILALGLALNLGGCSLFKKKTPPVVGSGTDVVPPSLVDRGTTPTLEPPRPAITSEPVEFPAEAGIQDVHFDYDKADIKRDQLAVLDKNLAYFKGHPDVKIMIEGHCDERGTTEYNFALGQRRAAAIQDFLLQGGVAADRLATISKGKDQPLDPARNEAAYAKNRRAHFMHIVQ